MRRAGGCYSDGEPNRNLGTSIAGIPAWHRRSRAPGWGGVVATGAGEERAHAVTGLGPERALCANDSYVSGSEGVVALRAPGFA